MKNLKKALVLLLCAVLLVVGSVMGTLAYLTSHDEVVNTFTVGKVAITLDEANVNEYGELADLTRVDKNEYKLIPGHTYIKDPMIRVDAESENCFLYVEVKNQISGIEDGTKIHDQLLAKGWTLLAGNTDTYYYKDICGAGYNVPTFEQFKIRGDVQDLSAYKGLSVIVTAYAVQADGFDGAQHAWNATFGATS